MNIQKKYLNFPVRFGGTKMHARLVDAGNRAVLRTFAVEIDEAAPDFWAFYDVSELLGRRIEIDVEGNAELFFKSLRWSDAPLGCEGLYHERHRPQFHFSTRRGWMNDPNGLFYYAGKYHLFYQHNPLGWGGDVKNMHWGHAVSEDLLHWQELDDCLHPDEHGTMYSGSAVIDWNNTSGLRAGEHPPILLFYTAAGAHAPSPRPFTQCMAFSTDGGASFHKYAGNPVLDCIVDYNRDPRVIWHEPSRQWVMALFLERRANDGRFALLTSPNLLQWNKTQEFSIAGTGECPELFDLPVENLPDQRKWVFMAGDSMYQVGQFDGSRFVPESEPHKLIQTDGYMHLYAGQCWTNAPNGRRIMIAWQQSDLWGMPFNSAMSIPVELTLRRLDENLHLCAEPIGELSSLTKQEHVFDVNIHELGGFLAGINGELLDIEMDVETDGIACLYLRGIEVILDATKHQIRCLSEAIEADDQGRFKLRILIDRASIEIFGANGRRWLGKGVTFVPENRRLWAKGFKSVHRLNVRELRSIWA